MNYKERGRKIYSPGSEKWRHLFIDKEYAEEAAYYVAVLLEQTPALIEESASELFESLGR